MKKIISLLELSRLILEVFTSTVLILFFSGLAIQLKNLETAVLLNILLCLIITVVLFFRRIDHQWKSIYEKISKEYIQNLGKIAFIGLLLIMSSAYLSRALEIGILANWLQSKEAIIWLIITISTLQPIVLVYTLKKREKGFKYLISFFWVLYAVVAGIVLLLLVSVNWIINIIILLLGIILLYFIKLFLVRK